MFYFMLSLCLTVKILYWLYLEINKLQVEAFTENLNLPLCWPSSFVESILLCDLSIIFKCYAFKSPKCSFLVTSCLDVLPGQSLFVSFNEPLFWIIAFSSYALHDYLIKIVLVACHLKNYSVIIYLLEDEQELSLGN